MGVAMPPSPEVSAAAEEESDEEEDEEEAEDVASPEVISQEEEVEDEAEEDVKCCQHCHSRMGHEVVLCQECETERRRDALEQVSLAEVAPVAPAEVAPGDEEVVVAPTIRIIAPNMRFKHADDALKRVVAGQEALSRARIAELEEERDQALRAVQA